MHGQTHCVFLVGSGLEAGKRKQEHLRQPFMRTLAVTLSCPVTEIRVVSGRCDMTVYRGHVFRSRYFGDMEVPTVALYDPCGQS